MEVKFNRQTLQQLADTTNSNRIIGGIENSSIRTLHGTIVGGNLNLNSHQNSTPPTPWTIKTAPGIKYQHTKDGVEYPGIFIYAGSSISFLLNTVTVESNWLTTGQHPDFLGFANFHSSSVLGVRTVLREDPTVTVDASWRTTQSFYDNIFVDKNIGVDGWLELPIPALAATPIYAVAFMFQGTSVVLALIATDTRISHRNVSSGSSSSYNVQITPDFSKFHSMMSDSEVKCYTGLIGSPIRLYDVAEYSEEHDLSSQFDFATGTLLNDKTANQIFNVTGALVFRDFSIDATRNSFIPRMNQSEQLSVAPSLSTDVEGYKYEFLMPLHPTVYQAPFDDDGEGAPPAEDTVYNLSDFVTQRDVADGRLYTFKKIHASGYNDTFSIIRLSDDNAEIFQPNCKVSFMTNKVTNFGYTPVLRIVPDYDSAELKNLNVYSSIRLTLCPIYLDNSENGGESATSSVHNVLAFYPKVTVGEWNDTASNSTNTMLPSIGTVTACEIFGQARFQENDFNGYPTNAGTNLFRRWGQICPRYASVPIENVFETIPGDCFIDIQPSQYQTSALSDDPGMLSGQYGSIQTNSIGLSSHAYQYYSLYHFAEAPCTNMSSYYPLSDIISVDSQTGTSTVLCTEIILSGVPDIGLVARVQNRISGENNPVPVDGAHLEYISLSSIVASGPYWLRGGDATTNYGISLKLGNGVKWVTISVEDTSEEE